MARKLPKKAKKSIKAKRKSSKRGKARNPKQKAKMIRSRSAVNPSIIRHTNSISDYEEINKWTAINGMVVRFFHNKTGIHDIKPLVFIMDTDEFNSKPDKRSISGINLNYLPETTVQKMFTRLSRDLPMTDTKHGHSFTRFAIRDEENPSGLPGHLIYSKIISPIIVKEWDCYRTYLYKNLNSVQIINYKMNWRGTPTTDEEGRLIYEN